MDQHIRKPVGALRWLLRLCAVAVPLVSVSCIDDNNPFADTDNVGIHMASQTAISGDSVSVFSSETLSVIVTLKEYVDYLLVSASANRTWEGVDSTIGSDAFAREPLPVIVSFFDTGWEWVAFTTVGGGSVQSTDTLWFYVGNPLAQDTVTGFFGDSLFLRSMPVEDEVTYVWSFGPGSNINAEACSTNAVVYEALASGTGEVYVTDGLYRSPGTSFVFTLSDTTPPTITCINTEYTGGDTIATGNTAFNFKVEVADDGGRAVEDVSFNGMAFDDTVNSNQFYRLIPEMRSYPLNTPLQVVVRAADAFGNADSSVFYLAYDDTLPVTQELRLTLTYPTDDSSLTGSPLFSMVGLIESTVTDSSLLLLAFEVNDSLVLTDTMAVVDNVMSWFQQVPLTLGDNTVDVRLETLDDGDTVGEVRLWATYEEGLQDTTPPTLKYVRLGNSNAVGGLFYATAPEAVIRAYPIDGESGVEGVYFDGDTATQSGLWYYSDTLEASHTPEGAEFTVRAVDNNGNSTESTYGLVYNRLPIFDDTPESDYIRVGDDYRDTISAVDPDGDVVEFTRNRGPSSMSVAADGVISWTPAEQDTGIHTIKIRASDGFRVVYYTYTLFVSDSGVAAPVQLATRANDFPTYLVATEDTLSVNLQVKDGTGVSPFRYTVRLVGSGQLLLNQSTSNLLTWVPGGGDVGTQQLIVVVSDNVASSDTIYPRVLVVPPNRPCSLSATYNSPTTTGGAVDLNAYGATDSLVFHIEDPDDPALERHRITVYQARSKVTSVIDSSVSDSFMVVVDPTAFSGWDTVTATVEDIAGNRDTLVLMLYYGEPPDQPQLLSPSNGATNVPVAAQLQWSGSDPDGDDLTYEVWVGVSPFALNLVDSVTATSITVPGLWSGGTFFWRVYAHDWKTSTASDTYSFTTQ